MKSFFLFFKIILKTVPKPASISVPRSIISRAGQWAVGKLSDPNLSIGLDDSKSYRTR
jgi:hypothetical protein